MCGQLMTDPSPYVYVFDQHCGGGDGGFGAAPGGYGGGATGGEQSVRIIDIHYLPLSVGTPFL